MTEVLYSIDVGLFRFVNGTLQNSVFDLIMPVLTDLNKIPAVVIAVAAVLILMMIKGGTVGRTVAILLIVTIAFSDQLNSSWVKHLFDRTRPCHVLEHVRLLVSCGSGYSFPSSHAVNTFAAATILTSFYRRWTWAFAGFAAIVAFSRVYVGVHYPFDVAAGALLGIACGAMVLVGFHHGKRLWKRIRDHSTRVPGESQ